METAAGRLRGSYIRPARLRAAAISGTAHDFRLFAARVDTVTLEITLAFRPIRSLGSCNMAKKSTTQKKIHRTKKKSTSRARAAVRRNSKKSPRYVYYFGDGHADGTGSMKPLLGGKGANLHEMTRIGLPVPPGFTITTDVCTY